MSEALMEAVRGLHVADPDLGVKPLLAKLREQQPDLHPVTNHSAATSSVGAGIVYVARPLVVR